MSDPAPFTTITYMFTLEDMLQKLPPKSAAAAPLRGGTRGIVWLTLATVVAWLIYSVVLGSLEPKATWHPAPETSVAPTWPWTFGLVVLSVIVWWLYIKGFLKRYHTRLADAHALGPLPLKVTATLEQEGFRIETVSGTSLVYWRNMYAVAESDTYIFLVGSLMKMYPIPRRAFSSRAEAEAFRHEANRRMREAGGGRTVPDEPSHAAKQ